MKNKNHFKQKQHSQTGSVLPVEICKQSYWKHKLDSIMGFYTKHSPWHPLPLCSAFFFSYLTNEYPWPCELSSQVEK